ncbi:MAG: hypothetical protein EOO38_20160 [Cytophagaceae bacterium]|nr:MAG: hypothetical protein EOO38_20160 [Cytophagaceae bacterium]
MAKSCRAASHHILPFGHFAGVHRHPKPTGSFRAAKRTDWKRPLADAKGGSKVRAMWPVILLIFVLGLQAFALWKGYIGIYGSAVYRSENAALCWAQLIILGAGALVLGVAIARGDL